MIMKEIWKMIINGDTICMSATFYFFQKVVATFIGFLIGIYFSRKSQKVIINGIDIRNALNSHAKINRL